MGHNRIAKYYGEGAGDIPYMGKGTPAGKTSTLPEVPTSWDEGQRALALKTQPLIVKAIKRKWKGKDAAPAKKIGVSQSGLSNLKRLGAHADTPTLRALCTELAIDPEELLIRHRIIDVKPTFKRPDLHAILDTLVGTADEIAVERVLQAFAKASKS